MNHPHQELPGPILNAEVLALVGAGSVMCIGGLLSMEAVWPGLPHIVLPLGWAEPAIIAAAMLHALVTIGHTYVTYGSHLRMARDGRSVQATPLTTTAKVAFAAMWFPALVIVMHAAFRLWPLNPCLAVALFEALFAPALALAMERRPFVLFDGLDGLRSRRRRHA